MILVTLLRHFLGEGCASLTTGTKAFDKDIEFDNMRWFETPSVVHDGAGNTKIIDRWIV